MERVAFISWLVATFALIDIGMMSMPFTFGRKGYQPRIGLLAGITVGILSGFIGLFVFKPLIDIGLEIVQGIIGAAFNNITIADDLTFGVSFGGGQNFLPIKFDVSEARTETLAFVQAMLAGIIPYFGGMLTLNAIKWGIPNRVVRESYLPEGTEFKRITVARQLRGSILRIHYLIAIVLGIAALTALMWNIVKGTFTMTAVSNTIAPAELTGGRELSELDVVELSEILTSEDRVSGARLRTLVQIYILNIDTQTASEIRNNRLSSVLEDDQVFRDFPDTMTWQELGDDAIEGSVQASVDILGKNVSREELAVPVFNILQENGELSNFVISRFFNEQAEIEDFSRSDINDLARNFVENSTPEALRGREVNTIDGILLTLNQEGGFQYQAIVETIIRDAIAALEEDALVTEARTAQVEFDENDYERATLEDDLFDKMIFAADSPIVNARRNLLMQSYLNTGMSDDDLRQILLDNFDIFTPATIRTLAQKEVSTADRERFLGIVGGETLSKLQLGSFELAAILADQGGLDAEAMRQLVLELVLPQHPADSARLNEILEDDEIPFGSVDRVTFKGLRDNPLVVQQLFIENISRDDLETLVVAEVVQPRVIATWPLHRTLFDRDGIEKELDELNAFRLADNPDFNEAKLEFRSWLSIRFLFDTLNAQAELTGMRNAILGTLWMIGITILFAFPIGIGAAIYLEEYAQDNALNRLIQTNIDNLAGVPSIIYGLLGVTLFVRTLEPLTSGSVFGFTDATTANGRTILSAAFTMGLLILPIIIINAQEAISAVQPSIRQASYGLGATKWQTVRNHVLPYSMPGILTGTILAVSRAIGETAPLIVVGAATFIVKDPSGPFSKFTALPIQIYNWTSQPRDADKAVAAAAIIVLLVMLIMLNSTAILLRNHFEKRLRGK
jgi:phosphate transport system permease protein